MNQLPVALGFLPQLLHRARVGHDAVGRKEQDEVLVEFFVVREPGDARRLEWQNFFERVAARELVSGVEAARHARRDGGWIGFVGHRFVPLSVEWLRDGSRWRF